MSACIRGREVGVRLRHRTRRQEVEEVRVVCPARWSKADFLRYVRAEHPEDTAVITDWMDSTTDGWVTRLWIANPAGFRDYPRALER